MGVSKTIKFCWLDNVVGIYARIALPKWYFEKKNSGSHNTKIYNIFRINLLRYFAAQHARFLVFLP